MTELRERVYAYLRRIPCGKVVTYGQIAQALGNPKLARAVGNVLHRNPDESQNPCFRVVDRDGKLSEHFAFGGTEGQRERLLRDGISVTENRVDLSRYQWNEE
jgi:O-6-methylguanine DNA methyltransferase